METFVAALASDFRGGWLFARRGGGDFDLERGILFRQVAFVFVLAEELRAVGGAAAGDADDCGAAGDALAAGGRGVVLAVLDWGDSLRARVALRAVGSKQD